MTRRALIAACAALLLLAAPAWPHAIGAREDHVLDVTLSREYVRVDYDITINQPGHSRTMTNGQFRMFATRGGGRVAKLLTVAIDGQKVPFTTTVVERTPTFEKYRFDAPVALTDGLHEIDVFDMNLAYHATGSITFHADGDVRLPRAIEDERLAGEVLFKFGVGVTPPAQNIYPGKARPRTAAAPQRDPRRRWPWIAGVSALAVAAGVGLLLARRKRRSGV